MPRPVWSGAISFGLVTIPIKVVTATEDHSISFHQYHLEDMGRIRYRKICELDGKTLADHEIGRGYEASKDTIVEITDDELRDIPLPTAKAIELVGFLPYDSIDPIRISQGYYLEPDGQVAARPYVLLRKALERSSKAAIARFAWHGRERLGLLRAVDTTIALHAMRWDDEIRDAFDAAPPPVEIGDHEVDAAIELIESLLIESLQGEDFTDRYTDALHEVIEAKREGVAPPKPVEEEPAGQVVDLMTALEQSVQQAQASRAEPATVHEMPTPEKGAKKTPAKKTTEKKTTEKKTIKKTTGRKSRSA